MMKCRLMRNMHLAQPVEVWMCISHSVLVQVLITEASKGTLCFGHARKPCTSLSGFHCR